jgi:uncharacterized protein (DUF362 family)/Pyruvate/2-oxoacid:ferredoxin oxidoreductase delta subunit
MLAQQDRKGARVAIVRARRYDKDEVAHAAAHALDLLGGVEAIIHPTDRVFVKINHLNPPSPAERGIVTHPVFTEGVLSVLREFSSHLTVGDDVDSRAGDGFAVSGYRQMAARLGVRLVNLREEGFVEVPCHGKILEKVLVSRTALEADAIVNLPKLKTHSLTLFTGAVKNLYGMIPAGLRVRFHGEHNKSSDFAQILVDLFSIVRPKLTLLDAVVAMEGGGPAGGTLRDVGLILASEDAVALDAVATRLIGVNPFAVETTRAASEQDLGVGDLSQIKVLGEALDAVTPRGFRLPAGGPSRLLGRIPGPIARAVVRGLAARPVVAVGLCVGCAECERICPVGAAKVTDGKARIDRALCVRCMCCHEVCRFDAIRPVRGGFAGATDRLAGHRRASRKT